MSSAQAIITVALAITSCQAFTTSSVSSSNTPPQTTSRSSLIHTSTTTTLDAAVGNMHGESSCFMPLMQNDEDYVAPRTVQVRVSLFLYMRRRNSRGWCSVYVTLWRGPFGFRPVFARHVHVSSDVWISYSECGISLPCLSLSIRLWRCDISILTSWYGDMSLCANVDDDWKYCLLRRV